MEWMLKPRFQKPDVSIKHGQKILSIGSCFTEHIGNALADLKFDILQNPSGILFDPQSVCYTLDAAMRNEQIISNDLVQIGEVWHSWHHHSRFSGTDAEAVVQNINKATAEAHLFLQQASWLIITLGSSFSYRIQPGAFDAANVSSALPVANCHRAPAAWFHRHLMTIDETVSALDNTLHRCFRFNPQLKILFTISPVRHIRDGVVENNRSKARLIEAVHHLVNKFDKLYYFPAYEMVIDVLRDYRFYDVDLVHPNYAATQAVLEQFTELFMDDATQELCAQIKPLVTAARHRPSFPETEAHQQFLRAQLQKAQALQTAHPEIDFSEEIKTFTQSR